ncbi:tetratricopeptide repeat domain protein [Aspergillus saccharolyticus JOP 1030-1]|uniref:Tetratricopeptide repeat domain protein n=1 Tax=Aspergillus saccharolyticus JOP 1030-1 TaxID=1450539 RepID=A0A318ZB96_9EURO|nr:tetratricopeptide repeat domain protein [Aspergillus saccharolyticus JOP 1030-1]PYH44711.1 tetratricopeptide repeat domain protein [Aspergillus saccharolyticus JOP 1030-1]
MAPPPPTPDTAYYNLGTYTRTVKTTSAAAQTWFTRGWQWAYSFNHEEALRCFRAAAAHDPSCAMAHWGIAYSLGPNYNKAWAFYDRADLATSTTEALAALTLARERATDPAEVSLITALFARFPAAPDALPTDFAPLNHAYSRAMRTAHESHPTDIDITALLIEALMCISPRGLWNLNTGEPSGPHTIEARRLIETAFTTSPTTAQHNPTLCHLYIHLMEMSPFPEIALPAADRLRRAAPDAAHLLHMPSHIDMAVGDYRRSVESNTDAIRADEKYVAGCVAEGRTGVSVGGALYVAYRMHNICAKLYSALIAGQLAASMEAVEQLEALVGEEVLRIKSPPVADWVESFLGNRAHVLVRFGRWEEVLRLPEPGDREVYCTTYATVLYAKGVALTALGRVPEAEAMRKRYDEARGRVPGSRIASLPSKAVDVLAVGAMMLQGELEYRRGEVEQAFASLARAAELEDALPYGDPPPWMQPVRHAWGGLLLEQDRVAEAERVFREDLGMAEGFPRRKGRLNNVWGLHGLHECLVKQDKLDEARLLAPYRDLAIAAADVPIVTSCYCRLSAVSVSGKCCDC